MQIRDFSLPTPHFTPMPRLSDCEERTANLQRAHQNSDWDAIHAILRKGPVDPAVRNEVLFDALANTDDSTCGCLLATVRTFDPMDAATDSQILVAAAEKKHLWVVQLQLASGLIQPWAIRAALDIAERSNDEELVNLLRQWNR